MKISLKLGAANGILKGLYIDNKAAMKNYFETQLSLTRMDLIKIFVILSLMLTGSISAFHSIATSKDLTETHIIIRTAEKKNSAEVLNEMYRNRLLMY
jgi:hypothetical protein